MDEKRAIKAGIAANEARIYTKKLCVAAAKAFRSAGKPGKAAGWDRVADEVMGIIHPEIED